MKRFLFGLIASLPLGVCLALWLASYLPKHWHFYAVAGNIQVIVSDIPVDISGDGKITNYGGGSVDDVPWKWRHGGFAGGSWMLFGYRSVGIRFPIYVPTGIAAVLSALAIKKITQTPRSETIRCMKCDYDLRATPDRCPECGAIPAISNQKK